jgi:integrase
MTVNFYLGAPNRKGESRIYIYLRGINNEPDFRKVIKIPTAKYLESKYWNNKEQNVRKNFNLHLEYNNKLLEDKSKILKYYSHIYELEPKIKTPKLTDYLIEFYNDESKFIKYITPKSNNLVKYVEDLSELFEKFMEFKTKYVKKVTIQRYNGLKNHLKEFESQKKFKLKINNINNQFKDKFYNYLLVDKNNRNNSIQKQFVLLQTIFLWGYEEGLIEKYDRKLFKIKGYEPDIIVLTQDEINKIENVDLSKNNALDKVRDIFLFSVYTGQRFSDIKNLKFNDIVNNLWYLRTQKTSESNYIPLSSKAIAIVNKYNKIDDSFKVISSQKINEHLKTLGKLAEVNGIVKKTAFQGVNKIVMEKPKYEFLTFHIARKSFVTTCLEGGLSETETKRLSGHIDGRAFKRYVNLSLKDTASKLDAIFGGNNA